MSFLLIRALFFMCLLGALVLPTQAWAWILDMPDEVTVSGSVVRVSDVASGSIPSAQGDIVILGKGDPGSMVTVSRSLVLRKLVQAGLAGGVIFKGVGETQVNFRGEEISSESLRVSIRAQVQGLVPVAKNGAPATWFELELPRRELGLVGELEIKLDRHNPLQPGRNQLRVQVICQDGDQYLPVVANLHCYGEIPSAAMKIDRGTPLTPGLFNWEWLDLAETQKQLVTDRDQLLGACVARSLSTGSQLRQSDLKPIPVIESGDTVDLTIQRGGLVVTVRALARQSGCRGQTIPVRNELNGRLVNARVMGPGQVEWRN